ncbi:MAG: 1-deoxy-D-xylulose-5-phosphate reductoisomerase [Oxalobacter sp.]|nr:1-deoxy-D-xylulose-5-phosphate reductoisomerase [Oxalobacter sp.]
MVRQQIAVLGSTGSIGASTLDVISRHEETYRVRALTANSRVSELQRQCERFQPDVAVVGTAAAAAVLARNLKAKGIKTEVVYGRQAICDVAASPQNDAVMCAIVGAAGLEPALAAARAGGKLMLANKESLVMSGRLFMDALKESGATLLPIDSEHNAIFQCLPHTALGRGRFHLKGVSKVLLTASGGPFLNRALEDLKGVTPEEAVAHPKWVMGRKISVDSATMMNKGLEIIEAHWLFGIPSEQIEVVIHPQSVIHSMVSFVDGAMLAQLGNPDMRIPIAHALAYPDRIASGAAPLDLASVGTLAFEAPDFKRYRALSLAYDALKEGGSVPVVLNAANEVAVHAFLERRIAFTDIVDIVLRTMDAVSPVLTMGCIDDILEEDRKARSVAERFIA